MTNTDVTKTLQPRGIDPELFDKQTSIQGSDWINDVVIPGDSEKHTEYQTKTSDAVNHPSHYTYGSIEAIDYIEDKGFNYNLGNAIKYISRAGHKLNTIEDLSKAVWYINREIARLEKSNA